jgi:hypothetical protein
LYFYFVHIHKIQSQRRLPNKSINTVTVCTAGIENTVERIPKLLTEEKDQLVNFKNQIEEAKKEVGKPFEYEERLSEYVARQIEINTKLEFDGLQKQEDVILDDAYSGEEMDKRQQPELGNDPEP